MQIENTEKMYHHDTGGTYSCQYLITFCTKYNRKLLEGKYASASIQMFVDSAKENNIILNELNVFPDHVQLSIDCSPDINLRKTVNKLKMDVAHKLFEQFPELRSRTSCLWTRQTFIATIGAVSVAAVYQYVTAEENRRKANDKRKKSALDYKDSEKD